MLGRSLAISPAADTNGFGAGMSVHDIGGLRLRTSARCNHLSKRRLRPSSGVRNRRLPAKHIGGLGGLGRKWPQLSTDRQRGIANPLAISAIGAIHPAALCGTLFAQEVAYWEGFFHRGPGQINWPPVVPCPQNVRICHRSPAKRIGDLWGCEKLALLVPLGLVCVPPAWDASDRSGGSAAPWVGSACPATRGLACPQALDPAAAAFYPCAASAERRLTARRKKVGVSSSLYRGAVK
jgi:hypothetical protein